MNCDSVRPLLSPHLDGELPPAQSAELSGHLLSCSGCGAEYDKLKAASRMIRELPLQALPAGFMTRLHARKDGALPARAVVPMESSPSWFGPKPLAFAAAAAVCVVVFTGPFASRRLMRAPGHMISGAANDMPALKTAAEPPAPEVTPAGFDNVKGGAMDSFSSGSAQEADAAPAPQSGLVPETARMLEAAAAGRGAGGLAGGGTATAAVRGMRRERGAAYGSAPQMTNEELNQRLQKESEELGIKAAGKQEEKKQSTAFMGDRLGPQSRKQAEEAIESLTAMRRNIEANAGRAATVPIDGTVAPVLRKARPSGDGQAITSETRLNDGFWSGDFGGPNQGTGTFENEKDWAELWRGISTGAPPAVDFRKVQVVAVFLGARPTGGYSVEFVETKRTATKLVVRFREHAPAPGTSPSDGATNPYAMKAIPRSDLPVRFEQIK